MEYSRNAAQETIKILDEAIKNMKLLNIGGFVNKFKKTDGNIN